MNIDFKMNSRLVSVALAVLTPVVALGAAYEFRAEKDFVNEVDDHRCKQLFINDREVGWVNRATETTVGLAARICKAEASPYNELDDPSRTYGGVLDGWHIVDLKTGEVTPLLLPQSDDFSNPTFCGRWAAYWGVNEGMRNSLIVTELGKRRIAKRMPIAEVKLETDNMYHLAPAMWDDHCTRATFTDGLYVTTDAVDEKSN